MGVMGEGIHKIEICLHGNSHWRSLSPPARKGRTRVTSLNHLICRNRSAALDMSRISSDSLGFNT